MFLSISIDKIDTSKVPPPKSNTKIISFFKSFLSNPYAKAAAVGSFITLNTLSPQSSDACLVRVLWESLKYAGRVITNFYYFLL